MPIASPNWSDTALLQTLFSSLVAFFWLRFGGSGDREHIDAVTGQPNVREKYADVVRKYADVVRRTKSPSNELTARLNGK